MVARTDGDSSRQPPPAFHLSAVPATDITTQKGATASLPVSRKSLLVAWGDIDRCLPGR
jgi:hypothetical protein